MSFTCTADSAISEYEIPGNLPTWFKAWMPYTAITDETSVQWKMQQQAYTDESGFRRIEEDYMVAMGSYYAEKCGERLKITLEGGKEFSVIVGEFKDDSQTAPLNMYHLVVYEGEEIGANILEFIVDSDIMDEKVLLSGTVCDLGFEGEIIKIEKLDT